MTGMVTETKEVIRKLAPVGVWVFLISFGLIAVDQEWLAQPLCRGSVHCISGYHVLGLERLRCIQCWRE